MPRVKRGKNHLKRRKKILKQVEGYNWGRKKLLKLAKTAILKAGSNAFKDRRVKKREKRALWQVRIGTALAEKDLSYSKFMGSLKKSNIVLNRKMMSELALEYPAVFNKVIKIVSERSE